MRSLCLLFAGLLLLTAGCKKNESNGPDSCDRKELTGVKSSYRDSSLIRYHADGSLDLGPDFRYFNEGKLIERVGAADVVVLDSIGRVKSMDLPFDFGRSRQTRYYFYDEHNRVVKTLSHTGNGIDYWAGLVYDNDDVVEMYYGINTPITSYSRFRYSYYDTPAVDQYLAIKPFGQIGTIRNKHLLKSASSSDNKYSYVLDSHMRVLTRYDNYDNSGWHYERATDTTWYFYSCR